MELIFASATEQGKGIVNSISLKEGEEKFREHAGTVLKYGAAVVVMAFDEKGQADSLARRVAVCSREYRILTKEAGVAPEEIPSSLPHLNLAQVFDALSYYSDHQDEINAHIERNRIPDDRIDPLVANR